MTTHYLSPGPSRLPDEVRSRVHAELLDTFGYGVSVMEVSHRSDSYAQLSHETLTLVKKVLGVPDTHVVLLTPFGAQQHFSLLIHHLSSPGDTISYVNSGVWSGLAVKDAQISGRKLDMVFDGSSFGYSTLGEPDKYVVDPKSKFLHLTVNNTVYGTEYPQIPTHLPVPLVLDMTSSLASRHDIPWEKVGLVYASAQKNFGIAGMSVVVMRQELLEEADQRMAQSGLGDALNYAKIYAKKSALNTPPVMPIYIANRCFQWIEAQGGVPEMERRAQENAAQIYGEIDGSFYLGKAVSQFRSRHNFVFDLKTPQLVEDFVSEAKENKILEVRGYRTVGGIRASVYNGVSQASAKEFVSFMRSFRANH